MNYPFTFSYSANGTATGGKPEDIAFHLDVLVDFHDVNPIDIRNYNDHFTFDIAVVNALKTNGTGFLGHMKPEVAQWIITDLGPTGLGQLTRPVFDILSDYFSVAQLRAIVPTASIANFATFPFRFAPPGTDQFFNYPLALARWLNMNQSSGWLSWFPDSFKLGMELVNLLHPDESDNYYAYFDDNHWGFLRNMDNARAQRIINDNTSYQLGIMSKWVFDIIGDFFGPSDLYRIPAAALEALLFPLTVGGTTYSTAQEFAHYLDTTTYADVKNLLPKRFRFVPDVINNLRADGNGFLGQMTEELARRIITDNHPEQLGRLPTFAFDILRDYFTVAELDSIVPTTIANFITYPMTIGSMTYKTRRELGDYLNTITYTAEADKLKDFKFEMALVNHLATDGTFLAHMDDALAKRIIKDNTTYQLGIMTKGVFDIIGDYFEPSDLDRIPAAKLAALLFPLTVGGITYNTDKDFASFLDTTTYADIQSKLPKRFRFVPDLVNALKVNGTGFLGHMTEELARRIIGDNHPAQLGKLEIGVFDILEDYFTQTELNSIVPTASIAHFITYPVTLGSTKYNGPHELAAYLDTTTYEAIKDKLTGLPLETTLVNLLNTSGTTGFLAHMSPELAQKIIDGNTSYEWGIMKKEVYDILEPFFKPEQYNQIPAARRRRDITALKIGDQTYTTPQEIAAYLDTTFYAEVKPKLPPEFKFYMELVNFLKPDGRFMLQMDQLLAQRIFKDNVPAQFSTMSMAVFNSLKDYLDLAQLNSIIPSARLANRLTYPVKINTQTFANHTALAAYLDTTTYAVLKDHLTGEFRLEMDLVNKLNPNQPFLRQIDEHLAQRIINDNTPYQLGLMKKEVFNILEPFFTADQLSLIPAATIMDVMGLPPDTVIGTQTFHIRPQLVAFLDTSTYAAIKNDLPVNFKFDMELINRLNPNGRFMTQMNDDLAQRIFTDNDRTLLSSMKMTIFNSLKNYLSLDQLRHIMPNSGIANLLTYPVKVGEQTYATPSLLAAFLDTTNYTAIKDKLPGNFRFEMDLVNKLNPDGLNGFLADMDRELAQKIITDNTAYQLGNMKKEVFNILEPFFTQDQLRSIPPARVMDALGLPVRIDTQTFDTLTTLSAYLDTTTYAALKNKVTTGLKLSVRVINRLKKDGTGFLQNMTDDLAARILTDNTPAELGTMKDHVFQKLQRFLKSDQLNKFPVKAIARLLNIERPDSAWGVNIAQWLPARVRDAIAKDMMRPGFKVAGGFFACLSPEAVSFLDPNHFAAFNDIAIYKSLFAQPFSIDPNSGETVWAKQYKRVENLSRDQLRKIPAPMLSRLIEESAAFPSSGPRDKDMPYRWHLPIGFLKKLDPAQITALRPGALALLHPAQYSYLQPAELADLLRQFSGDQVRALPDRVLTQVLNDAVADQLHTSNQLAGFTGKVPWGKKHLLSNQFFQGEPTALRPDQTTYLTGLSAKDTRNPSRTLIEVLGKLSVSDAARFGTSTGLFKEIANGNLVAYTPALFFKQLSQQQIDALSADAIPRLSNEQIWALGDQVLKMSDAQLDEFSRQQYDAVRSDVIPGLNERIQPVSIRSGIAKAKQLEAGEAATLRLRIEGKPNKQSFIYLLYVPEIKGLVRYEWNNLDSFIKGRLVLRMISERILDTCTKEQLLSLDEVAMKELMRDIGSLRRFTNALVKIPGYGLQVYEELLKMGRYDAAYIAASQRRAAAGSATKYGAQVFVVVGSDRGQQLSSLAYATKMANDIPTLIYRYKSAIGAPELVSVINNTGNVSNDKLGTLLAGKKVRTYILGHGNRQKLTIGGFPEDDKGPLPYDQGELTRLSYSEAYQVLDKLWRTLSPNDLSVFTKLSILGCELAAPPTQWDAQGKEIPEIITSDWDTYFDKSFLGKISALFFAEGNLEYRNNLRISAFSSRTVTETGQTVARLYYDKTNYNDFSRSQRHKINAFWSFGQNRIARESGSELGDPTRGGRYLQANYTLDAATFYLPVDELQEAYIHDLALAVTEPDLEADASDSWSRTNTLSAADDGGSRAIVFQYNPEDGDTASTHVVWDVAEPQGSTTSYTAKPGTIIRGSGADGASRMEHALDQLQTHRTRAAAGAARADEVLALPEFKAMSDTDKKEARLLISGGLRQTTDEELTATAGSLKALKALHAQKVSEANNLPKAADNVLELLNELTPAQSKAGLQAKGVATWHDTGTVSLDEARFKAILTDPDPTNKLTVLGAFLNLEDIDCQPLLQALAKSTDPVMQKVGRDIGRQWRTRIAVKAGIDPELLKKGTTPNSAFGGILNTYITITGIYNLIQNWNNLSTTQKALDLTLIVGSNLSVFGNIAVTRAMQKSLKAWIKSGTPVSKSIIQASRILPGLDIILTGISMYSIGVEWDTFWKSGAGTDSYEYKSLVASTVINVIFSAFGLVLSGSVMASSMSATVEATAVGRVAAASGPVGIALLVAVIIISGIVQGALILHEYGDYYENEGQKVVQFFASLFGMVTEATKRAMARKAAAAYAAAVAKAADQYQAALDSDWLAAQAYLLQLYTKQGYRQVVTPFRLFRVRPVTRSEGTLFNIVTSFGDTSVLSGSGDKGIAFVNMGDPFARYLYPCVGDAKLSNLFDLHNTRANTITGGGADDLFLINSATGVQGPINTGSGGKNTIMADADGRGIVVQPSGNQYEFIFTKSGSIINVTGSFARLQITNAASATIKAQSITDSMAFDVSGPPGAVLKIMGGTGGNSYMVREGNVITITGNDVLLWDGQCDARVSLEHAEDLHPGDVQMLAIRLLGDYHKLSAYRDGDNLVLQHDENKANELTIQGLYLDSGAPDDTKFLSLSDDSAITMMLSCLSVLGTAAVPLYRLSKTFIFSKNSGGTATAPAMVSGDQGMNTYSFSRGAGYFALNFFTNQLNQVLLETEEHTIRYKKKGDDLIIEPGANSSCSLSIASYFKNLEPNALLKLWAKPTWAKHPLELTLQEQADLAEDTFVSYTLEQQPDAPAASAAHIYDLYALSEDVELDVLDADFLLGGGKLHVSIPEWGDSQRVIQCRYGDRGLALYFADNPFWKAPALPPMLIIRHAFFLPAGAFQLILHQDRYQPGGGADIFMQADYLPNTAARAFALTAEQQIQANLRPGESHYYTFTLPADAGSSSPYHFDLYVLAGNCDLQVDRGSGLSADPGYSTDRQDAARPNIKSIIATDAPGTKVTLVVSIDPTSITATNRYALSATKNYLVPAAPDDYTIMPETSILPVNPTRLLSSKQEQRLEVSGYPVISSRGGKITFFVDLSTGYRSEWIIDCTTIDSHADQLLLAGDCTFSTMEFVAAGPDLGLRIPMKVSPRSTRQKMIWIKDYNTNPVARDLTVKLAAYTTSDLVFGLPVYVPSSGCFMLPPDDTVAVTGSGLFILDLDFYGEEVTTVYVPDSLFVNPIDGYDSAHNKPDHSMLSPLYIDNGEQLDYDLRISNQGLTLYIRNYYRNPRALRFCLVDNPAAGSKSYRSLPNEPYLVFPASPFKYTIKGLWDSEKDPFGYFSEVHMPVPLEFLVPLIVNWPRPSLFDHEFGWGESPSFMDLMNISGIYKFDPAGFYDGQDILRTSLLAYCDLFDLLLGSLPKEILDQAGNNRITLSPATRRYFAIAPLMQRASKGMHYANDSDATRYQSFCNYYATATNVSITPTVSVDINTILNIDITTVEEARRAIELLDNDVSFGMITIAVHSGLTTAQVLVYTRNAAFQSNSLEDFIRYASYVSGKALPAGIKPLSLTPQSPDSEKQLLRAGLEGIGYMADRAEIIANALAYLKDPVEDIARLDQLLYQLKPASFDEYIQLFLLQKMKVTALDVQLSNKRRLEYETGNRNHLVTMIPSAHFGNEEQTTYQVLRAMNLTTGFTLTSPVSNDTLPDLIPGSLVLPGGPSPSPIVLVTISALPLPAADKNLLLLANIWKANPGPLLLKAITSPANTSWYGRSTPDNLVDGSDRSGEAYSWRPAIRYDSNGKAVPTQLNGQQTLTFQFRHKIIVMQLHLTLSYQKVMPTPYDNSGKYRIEMLGPDGVWIGETAKTISWTRPATFDKPFVLSFDVSLLAPSISIPYIAYRLVGVEGIYDHDTWIDEVTFTTAAVATK